MIVRRLYLLLAYLGGIFLDIHITLLVLLEMLIKFQHNI